MTVQRIAQVIKLRPEWRARYVEAHANPWPEVIEALARRNIRAYSIFLHGDLLFAYVEYDGQDFAADMQKAFPGFEQWRQEMVQMQEPLATRAPGEWWASMEEVFRFERPSSGAAAGSAND